MRFQTKTVSRVSDLIYKYVKQVWFLIRRVLDVSCLVVVQLRKNGRMVIVHYAYYAYALHLMFRRY